MSAMVLLSNLITHSNPCCESMQTSLELNRISIHLGYCGLTGISHTRALVKSHLSCYLEWTVITLQRVR